jgi:hypothetical protein
MVLASVKIHVCRTYMYIRIHTYQCTQAKDPVTKKTVDKRILQGCTGVMRAGTVCLCSCIVFLRNSVNTCLSVFMYVHMHIHIHLHVYTRSLSFSLSLSLDRALFLSHAHPYMCAAPCRVLVSGGGKSSLLLVHVHIHTYIHLQRIHMYTRMHTSTRTYIHTYIHTYIQQIAIVCVCGGGETCLLDVYVHAHTKTDTHTHTHTHTHTPSYMHTYTYAHMQLNAIMGASGGGKTSLLDVLADRKDPNHVKGTVRSSILCMYAYFCAHFVYVCISQGPKPCQRNGA